MRTLNVIAMALLVIGGLNWLLVGLFSFDLVAAIFGGQTGEHTLASRIVYVAVGIAALYGLFLFKPISENHHERLPHSRV
jgi:uncharacterized membrane protein YuzA (DUF378 family)